MLQQVFVIPVQEFRSTSSIPFEFNLIWVSVVAALEFCRWFFSLLCEQWQ